MSLWAEVILGEMRKLRMPELERNSMTFHTLQIDICEMLMKEVSCNDVEIRLYEWKLCQRVMGGVQNHRILGMYGVSYEDVWAIITTLEPRNHHPLHVVTLLWVLLYILTGGIMGQVELALNQTFEGS